MGTLWRYRGVLIRMYRDHNPPHFHISTKNGEAQVALTDFSLMNGRVDRRDFDLAVKWARANASSLWTEWNRLNG